MRCGSCGASADETRRRVVFCRARRRPVARSEAESKDRALQQRVRRLHSKIEKGIVNANTLVDIEREFEEYVPFATKTRDFLTQATDAFVCVKVCSQALDERGFVKLSKREAWGGKLVPGEWNSCRRWAVMEGTAFGGHLE